MTNTTKGAPVRATTAKAATLPAPAQEGTRPPPADPQSVWSEHARPVLRDWVGHIYDLNYTIISDEAEGPATKLASLADEIIMELRDAADDAEAWKNPYAFHFELSHRSLALLEAAYRATDLSVGDPATLVRQAAILGQLQSWVHLVSETVLTLPEGIDALQEACKGTQAALSAIATLPTPQTMNKRLADGVAGYTAKQMGLVLGQIAGMAATVCDSLKASLGDGTEVDPSLLLILVSHIGSVADQVGDSFVIGSPADWCVGQRFQKAGAV